MKNIDIKIVIGISSISSFLFLIPLYTVGVELDVLKIIVIMLFISSIALGSYFLSLRLENFFSHSRHIMKFCIIGLLNTALDFAIINYLMILTSVASGPYFSLFKVLSFMVGVSNGYIFNKYWTYGDESPFKYSHFFSFVAFNAPGAVINVAVATILVNLPRIPENISPALWANISIFFAMLFALVWNFTTQHFFVFKENMKREKE